MRQVDTLSLSEQFSIWCQWDRIARKHFGPNRRPDPPNVEFDVVSAGVGLLGLWLWGGWVLAYYAFYAKLVTPFVVGAYFSIGWMVVGLLSILLALLLYDPVKKHTIKQAAVINRYNFAMADLALERRVDLSKYCYDTYDDATIYLVAPTKPVRPPTPKPIDRPEKLPSKKPTERFCSLPEENPHLVSKPEVMLPDNILTPARMCKIITDDFIKRHPTLNADKQSMVDRALGRRQEILYDIQDVAATGLQLAVYNYHRNKEQQ